MIQRFGANYPCRFRCLKTILQQIRGPRRSRGRLDRKDVRLGNSRSMPSIAFGHSNGEDPAVISTCAFAEIYFNNATGQPITLPRKSPVWARRPRAPEVRALSTQAARRSNAAAVPPAAIMPLLLHRRLHDSVSGHMPKSIFNLVTLPLRANTTMAVWGYPTPASTKRESQANDLPHHQLRKALKHPGIGTNDGVR